MSYRTRINLPLYGKLKEHISFSELRLFNECQWKWLLLKVFGYEVAERSFQMDFGTVIHAGMEMLYTSDKPILIVESVIDFTTKSYDEMLSSIGELHPSDKTEALRIRELIPNIFRDVLLCPELQGIRPIKSELNLYETISRTDGLDLKFKGFIDFIFVKELKTKSVIYIADFKTCQWGWPAKKLSDIEVISQILLYKHFFCKLTGADPKNVTAAFILLKKLPPKDGLHVEVAKISAGPKATESAIEYMQKAITGMHSYGYEQNFQSCKRSWTDRETKEERSVQCQFMGTDKCPGSAE